MNPKNHKTVPPEKLSLRDFVLRCRHRNETMMKTRLHFKPFAIIFCALLTTVFAGRAATSFYN